MQDISIVGIGRLGLPLAVVFASRGFRVIGVDVDQAAIDAVNARRIPSRIYEPGLQELMDGLEEENLIATDDLVGAVQNTDASIVLVPTPSDTLGAFTLDYVLPVCRGIGGAIKGRAKYHLVVISSTVMPGACDGPIRGALEKASGKGIGDGWGLCYCPEFIALGNAVRGFLDPDFVLIGSSDSRAATELADVYRWLCLDAPMAQMSLVNAEITKIALNCSITVKITLANQLAELCEAIPGADVDDVTRAIGLDHRIGPAYFRGGPKFGGPCFPRDTRALSTVARDVGVRVPLIEEVDRINVWQSQRLSRLALAQIGNRKKVTFGVLGLAYKTDTNIGEESPGLGLVEGLKPFGHDIVAHDPLVRLEGHSLQTAQEAVDYSDVVVVAMNWPEFGEVRFRQGQVVIDCWRCLDQGKVTRDGAKYIAIGWGPK